MESPIQDEKLGKHKCSKTIPFFNMKLLNITYNNESLIFMLPQRQSLIGDSIPNRISFDFSIFFALAHCILGCLWVRSGLKLIIKVIAIQSSAKTMLTIIGQQRGGRKPPAFSFPIQSALTHVSILGCFGGPGKIDQGGRQI